MFVVFAASFLVGLILAVHAMLHGVERRGPVVARPLHEETTAHDPATEPSPVLNAQTLGAALAAFGLAGSALDRWTTLDGAVLVGAAVAAAVAAGALSVWLLAGWAVPSARVDVEDERYLMQGHPATVTRAIGDDDAGEIAYEADGRQWTVRARSWDGAPLAAGTEVAIERVEDGVAYVEGWAAVETRL
jgi:hypothetical protein